jgi:predicted acylesterase/phospholipase RssA
VNASTQALRQKTDFSESPSRPKVGLVLGAGGIRGCAHAGVIAVLREARVPVDVVVGASVGAMFGLALAAGLPTERIAQLATGARPLDLFRFYAGRLRTEARNPIARLLWEAGAGQTFSDLALPFAVLGTDMETGRPHVIDSGPVLPAVQASIALPFIARSVALDGRHYLDGGLLDTAPIPVARRLGADRVIAVCLGFNYCAPRFLRQRPWTQRWLERAGRQRRPVGPGLRDQIRFGFRLYAATYNPPLPAQDADVVIWPEFNGLNPNSIFGAQFCLEQGMIATREALPEIRSLLSSVRPSA